MKKEVVIESYQKYIKYVDRIEDDKKRQIVSDRINGLTCREIGQKLGLTPELTQYYFSEEIRKLDKIMETEEIINNDITLETKIDDVIPYGKLYSTLKRMGFDTIRDIITKRDTIDKRKKAILQQVDDIINGLKLTESK